MISARWLKIKMKQKSIKEIINKAMDLINMYSVSLKDCNTIDDKWDDEELEKEYFRHLELISDLKSIEVNE